MKTFILHMQKQETSISVWMTTAKIYSLFIYSIFTYK